MLQPAPACPLRHRCQAPGRPPAPPPGHLRFSATGAGVNVHAGRDTARGRSRARPRQGRARDGRGADVSAIFRKLKTVPTKYNNNYKKSPQLRQIGSMAGGLVQEPSHLPTARLTLQQRWTHNGGDRALRRRGTGSCRRATGSGRQVRLHGPRGSGSWLPGGRGQPDPGWEGTRH